MTQMVSVQVRFPPEELKRIDNYIKNGEFSSRAEFIRDAVRKAEMLRAIQTLREIMNKEGVSEKDLIEGGKKIRNKLFKEMFGDNQ